jgi:GT2 family glycosyltransferase
MPAVTVLIINYNHGKRLEQCLRAVDALLLRDVELVVFDNNSSDDSLSRILDHPARPRLVRSPRNVGFSRAANLGIRDRDAPFMLLLNPDALLTPPYLGLLMAVPQMGRSEACHFLADRRHAQLIGERQDGKTSA